MFNMSNADLNADGLQDIVVSYFTGTHELEPVRVFINNRKGSFKDVTSSIFVSSGPGSQHAREQFIAEFNGDGRPDVFVADHGYDFCPDCGFQNQLILSFGKARLVNATKNLIQQKDYTHSASAGDLDGDGDIDLLLGNTWDLYPQILINNGAGKFSFGQTPPRPDGAAFYSSCHIADLNNDGSSEIILGAWANENVKNSDILLNDGTGHFSVIANALPPRMYGTDGNVLEIQSTDLNGDGYQDLITANTPDHPYYKGWGIQILINNGNATFRDETKRRIQGGKSQENWMRQIELVDINGDGALDLATRTLISSGAPGPLELGAATFFLNNGNGHFKPLQRGFGKAFSNIYALIDVDGDGGRDILTEARDSDDYYLVRDIGTPIMPGIAQQLSATKKLTTMVVVSWLYVWGAVEYEVWRAESGSTQMQQIATTKFTWFHDKNAIPGKEYRYFVRALNSAGKSKFSSEVLGFRFR